MALSTEHGRSLFLLVTILLILFFLFLIYIPRFMYLTIKRHLLPQLPFYLSRGKSQATGVQWRGKRKRMWWRDMEGMRALYEIDERGTIGGGEVDAQGREVRGEMWERGGGYWDEEDEKENREGGWWEEVEAEMEMGVVERGHGYHLPARASRWLYDIEMEPSSEVERGEDHERGGGGWREIPIRG